MIQSNAKAQVDASDSKTVASDLKLKEVIIDSIRDIKGKNIVFLDLTGLEEAPANYFIICEGESVTQMRAISQNVYKRVKEELASSPNHMEGLAESKWILVDYFTTVVHIFYPDTREFYNLEGLWNDASFTKYDDPNPSDNIFVN